MSWIFKLLDRVERIGNRLPHPFWLFGILILIVVGGSSVLEALGVGVVRPEIQILRSTEDGAPVDGRRLEVGASFNGLELHLADAARSSRLENVFVEIHARDKLIQSEKIDRAELASLRIDARRFEVLQTPGEYRLEIVNRARPVKIASLLSRAGLRWFVLQMVDNFATFEPLGLVLIMLMGVAIAEGTGLIRAMMTGVAQHVPKPLITPALFGLAACGNIGSDAGIVVMPPLAAAVFRQLGRNPIVGLLVGYVGATAGFTANVVPTGTDVIAASLTNAATGGLPAVNVMANWYFMATSVLILAILATLVTEYLVAPRVTGSVGGEIEKLNPLTRPEKRGLCWAILVMIALLGLWTLTIIPEDGLLRHPDPDLFWRSDFFRGLVPVLFSLFAAGGIAYGVTTRRITRADDIIGFMTNGMRQMAGFIVLVLVIAQFTRAFQYANFDQLIAIEGARLLRAIGFGSFPLFFFVAFVVMTAVANLFVGSGSAKWAVFAPIFAPLFVTLGYHPAFTQVLYRIGDSVTNCVSPLSPYFPLLLGWISATDKSKAKVGTVLAYLTPYAVVLLGGWMLMLVAWYLLGLPMGPDGPIHLGG